MTERSTESSMSLGLSLRTFLMVVCATVGAVAIIGSWRLFGGDGGRGDLSLSSPWWQAFALAGTTLVSEDLACIAAGQLLGAGMIGAMPALLGCSIGIYVGDLGLWAIGRALRGTGIPAFFIRRIGKGPGTLVKRLEGYAAWFERHAGKAILVSRFIPGSRLPLYVAAGMLGRSGRRFAAWSFVAVLIWVPAAVLLVAFLGEAFVTPLRRILGNEWSLLAGIGLMFGLVRTVAWFMRGERRHALRARVARIWRWEFWPVWAFYAPIVPWIVWQSFRRGGLSGFSRITAANPGIPHGGFIGESKYRILSSIHSPHVLSTALVAPGILPERLACLDDAIARNDWNYPLVLKPDVGQRGVAVKLVRTRTDAGDYLAQHPVAAIAQPYHPGPYEAGIFYFRLPGEATGRIFSITDKQFPKLVGDGASTMRQLIWRHPRYRMQARMFLNRHASECDRVLATGEPFQLTMAGNHCQGTLFLDGSHLITPELERAIDKVARSFDGFYFGRFDVRYTDVESFKAGRDLAVLELNGVTSESTNIYDPQRSLWQAYRTLSRQWSILFLIADANLRLGHRATPPRELLHEIRRFCHQRAAPAGRRLL